jgi:hypothetical protein
MNLTMQGPNDSIDHKAYAHHLLKETTSNMLTIPSLLIMQPTHVCVLRSLHIPLMDVDTMASTSKVTIDALSVYLHACALNTLVAAMGCCAV